MKQQSLTIQFRASIDQNGRENLTLLAEKSDAFKNAIALKIIAFYNFY